MNKEDIKNLMLSIGLKKEQVSALEARGYFDAPASKGHHLAYPGGLAEHSMNVFRQLCALTGSFGIKWQRHEGPMIVGLLHDLVKMDSYEIEDDPLEAGKFLIKWCNKHGDNHGNASLEIADELKIELKADERMAIRYHMGRFGVGREYLEGAYRNALKNYGPQVLATHFADWWASEIIESKASVG